MSDNLYGEHKNLHTKTSKRETKTDNTGQQKKSFNAFLSHTHASPRCDLRRMTDQKSSRITNNPTRDFRYQILLLSFPPLTTGVDKLHEQYMCGD